MLTAPRREPGAQRGERAFFSLDTQCIPDQPCLSVPQLPTPVRSPHRDRRHPGHHLGPRAVQVHAPAGAGVHKSGAAPGRARVVARTSPPRRRSSPALLPRLHPGDITASREGGRPVRRVCRVPGGAGVAPAGRGAAQWWRSHRLPPGRVGAAAAAAAARAPPGAEGALDARRKTDKEGEEEEERRPRPRWWEAPPRARPVAPPAEIQPADGDGVPPPPPPPPSAAAAAAAVASAAAWRGRKRAPMENCSSSCAPSSTSPPCAGGATERGCRGCCRWRWMARRRR